MRVDVKKQYQLAHALQQKSAGFIILISVRRLIKSVTGRNLWLRYAFLAPWRLGYAAFSTITRANIAGHFNESEKWMQQYSRTVFDNYKMWAGIDRFYGKVAEVGPGDVSGVAELLLADGCSRVDQIDPFRHKRKQNPHIAQHLATAEEFFERHSGYDLIVSCAVLEHVGDPLRAILAMAKALNPGGMMIHAIDCRDHGQFSDRLHDLSFLRISPALYWPLTLANGLNRVRVSQYNRVLKELQMNSWVLVTSLSGVAEPIEPAQPFDNIPLALLKKSRSNLAAIRDKLPAPFKSLPDEDLLISGFALVATKISESVQPEMSPHSHGPCWQH